MRAVIASLALTLAMSMSATVALADEGDEKDGEHVDDPGIADLHNAITAMRDARSALRAECPEMSDAKCRTAFAALRSAFKEAHEKAIEKHHAFREEHKNRAEKAKAEREKAEKAKPHPSPSGSPRR